MKPLLVAIALVAAAPLAAQQTFTHSWSDTVVRGDTTRIYPVSVSSAYLVGPPAVIIKGPGPAPIDSIVTPPPPVPPVPTPPPPAPGGGVAVGAWHLPADSTCSSGYTGTTINGSSSMKADLDRVKACKGQTSISVARAASIGGNKLSVAAACSSIASWPDLAPYAGVVKTIVVADDIGNAFNGPNPPYLFRIDSIARCAGVRWPTIATAVRQQCSGLALSFKWRWLDDCWNQYDGPLHGDGTPAQYVAKEEAAGAARGLGAIFGLNGLDGGDGSSRILGTFPNAGASTVNRWQMSAPEFERAGTLFVKHTCYLPNWTWSPGFTYARPAAQLAGIVAFDKRADIKAAVRRIRVVGAAQPARACYVRP